MNIQKKAIFLMALCCSLGSTISAVERSKFSDPQEEQIVTTKVTKAESLDGLKKSVKEIADKIFALVNKYDLYNRGLSKLDPEHPLKLIKTFEELFVELIASKEDLTDAFNERNPSLTKNEILQKTIDFKPIVRAAEDLWERLSNEIKRVLNDVQIPQGKYNTNIIKLLETAKKNLSIDCLLEDLRKNIEGHEAKLQQYQTALSMIPQTDDSDEDTTVSGKQGEILAEENAIRIRSQLINDILQQFDQVKSNISYHLNQFFSDIRDV